MSYQEHSYLDCREDIVNPIAKDSCCIWLVSDTAKLWMIKLILNPDSLNALNSNREESVLIELSLQQKGLLMIDEFYLTF